MKMKLLSVLLLAILSWSAHSQVLLKNNQGEQILSPFINQNANGTLINLNTANASLGLDYLFTTKANDPSNYHIFRLGVTAKATDGLGPLVSDGQLTPGATFSGSITKVKVFAPEISNPKFSDWLSINASYSSDKYKIFNSDTIFSHQISTNKFKGFNLGLSYNMMLGIEKQDYISIGIGYGRTNNYNTLNSIEIQDYKTQTDASTLTERRYGRSQTLKQGIYYEYDTYPISISYTRLPKYQPKEIGPEKEKKIITYVYTKGRIDTLNHYSTDERGKVTKRIEYITYHGRKDTVETVSQEKFKVENPMFKSLKLGYALYFNSRISNNDLNPTISNLGGTLFFISPNKDNILTSRFGINVEFYDFFDTQKINKGPLDRLKIGFTTTFSL